MNFKKFTQFIHGHYLSDKDIFSLVNCAYQSDQKAKFKLGTYKELCALIKKLNEIKEFWQRHNE